MRRRRVRPRIPGIARRWQVESSPCHPAVPLLPGVERTQAVAQLRAGQRLNSDAAAQRLGTGPDRAAHLRRLSVTRMVRSSRTPSSPRSGPRWGRRDGIERAMAADNTRIGRREIRHPAGFKQRNQPCLMLPRHSHWPRDRHRKRTSLTDCMVEDGVNAPQERPAECRKTMRDQFTERLALIDTLYGDGGSAFMGAARHLIRSYSNWRRKLSRVVSVPRLRA
jgi:hypothetical protein